MNRSKIRRKLAALRSEAQALELRLAENRGARLALLDVCPDCEPQDPGDPPPPPPDEDDPPG